MKQTGILLLLIGLCSILSADESTSGTDSPENSARTLIDRQRSSLSLETLKKTVLETGEAFKRDCTNTGRLLRMLADIEKGRIALLGIAVLFCGVLTAAGLKKIHKNEHEQQNRQ